MQGAACLSLEFERGTGRLASVMFAAAVPAPESDGAIFESLGLAEALGSEGYSFAPVPQPVLVCTSFPSPAAACGVLH